MMCVQCVCTTLHNHISWIFRLMSSACTECVSDPTLMNVTPVPAMAPTCDKAQSNEQGLQRRAGQGTQTRKCRPTPCRELVMWYSTYNCSTDPTLGCASGARQPSSGLTERKSV